MKIKVITLHHLTKMKIKIKDNVVALKIATISPQSLRCNGGKMSLIKSFDGTTRLLNGKLHSINDEPSLVWNFNYFNRRERLLEVYVCQEWFFNGEHHRKERPAIVMSSGTQEWWTENVTATEINRLL